MDEKLKVPDEWCRVNHIDIAEINPKFDINQFKEDIEVSFLPMASVEEISGNYDLSQSRKLSAVKKGYTHFKNGDIIFAKITPCMENGKIAVLDNLLNGIGFGSTEFHVSRPYHDINAQFLFYYFVQSAFRKKAQRIMTGSAGQLRVSTEYFKKVNIPLPPPPEQRAIVAKIELLFSDLDNGIANLKKAQKQLKIYRQAVLKKAFVGELTRKWRAGQTDLPSAEELLQQIKEEREKRYQKQLDEWKKAVKEWEDNGKEGKKPSRPKKPKEVLPLAEEESVELPELPEGNFWLKLGMLTLNVEYGTSAKSKKEGKVPVLRMGNIQNNCFVWNDLVYTDNKDEINKYLLKKGDVLFNRTNSPELVGKTAIYNGEKTAIFAGYLIRINQIHRLVNSNYLNYFLNSYTAKVHGNTVKTDGVNQSNINGEKLKNYPFPYFSLLEQNQIVCEIETRLSVCDKLEETIAEALQKSEALRQSILKRAFEGKLLNEKELEEARNAPDWEPADKLLERITAEKEKTGNKK